MQDAVREKIRGYFLREFLPGENHADLTDTMPLISGVVLDSIATYRVHLCATQSA